MKKLLTLLSLTSTLFAARLEVLPTGSMAPVIPASGAIIEYSAKPFESVNIGDIVIFRREGKAKGYSFQMIIHRVIKKVSFANGETALVTKGDANKYKDAGYVTASEYVGVMTGFAK